MVPPLSLPASLSLSPVRSPLAFCPGAQNPSSVELRPRQRGQGCTPQDEKVPLMLPFLSHLHLYARVRARSRRGHSSLVRTRETDSTSARSAQPEAWESPGQGSLKWALTVRSEAGVAGVAVGVCLVHGFIHHGCHPDGQVGGECEHEATPVGGGRAERPVRVFGSFWVSGEVERGLAGYTGRRCRETRKQSGPCVNRKLSLEGAQPGGDATRERAGGCPETQASAIPSPRRKGVWCTTQPIPPKRTCTHTHTHHSARR